VSSLRSRLIAAALATALCAAFGASPKARAAKPPAKSAPKTAVPAASLKASATVRRWMKPMTLRDEIAQLIFISFHGAAPNSRTREYRSFWSTGPTDA
jgi:hypothetical protein